MSHSPENTECHHNKSCCFLKEGGQCLEKCTCDPIQTALDEGLQGAIDRAKARCEAAKKPVVTTNGSLIGGETQLSTSEMRSGYARIEPKEEESSGGWAEKFDELFEEGVHNAVYCKAHKTFATPIEFKRFTQTAIAAARLDERAYMRSLEGKRWQELKAEMRRELVEAMPKELSTEFDYNCGFGDCRSEVLAAIDRVFNNEQTK